jgi:chemotaxis signal transduction protein
MVPMTTMVCFRCAGADYCVPVQATRGVRLAAGMIALPSADTDIAGIITGQPPLTVIAALGAGGSQILILEAADKTFGLLVDAVTGLRQVTQSQLGPAPAGQRHALISGTVDDSGPLVLITDPDALAGRL